MRWDYGSVYKEIRRNKHLTQEEICCNYINRSTLTRFENNQTIPSYELMRFLLKQVDMTFKEFEYLCNYYQPSERQQLLYDIDNLKTPSTQQLEELIQRCKNHLKKEPDDIPIKRRGLRLETVVDVRKNSTIQTVSTTSAQLLWSQVINNDNWYYNDIIIVGSLLYTLPHNILGEKCDVLLSSLEKYTDFKRIKPTELSLYVGMKSEAIRFIHKLITLAKQEKCYDQLARSYVYLGIAEKKQELIDKGLQILELTEEQRIFNILKSFIKEVQTD